LESSDVVLLVLDVRYAPAMMPPELYNVVREAGKGIVVVLNKVEFFTSYLDLKVLLYLYFSSKILTMSLPIMYLGT